MTCFYERILHHTTYIPTPPTKDVFLSLRFSFVAQGAGVLRISIDGNDRMGAKIKTQCKRNAYGFRQNPQKISGPKITPSKYPMPNFQALKVQESRTSLVLLYSQNYAAGMCGHYHESSDCFE